MHYLFQNTLPRAFRYILSLHKLLPMFDGYPLGTGCDGNNGVWQSFRELHDQITDITISGVFFTAQVVDSS